MPALMEDYIRELELKKQELKLKRKLKEKIYEVEVILKNMTYKRYDLIYKMKAIEKLIREIALIKGYEILEKRRAEEEVEGESSKSEEPISPLEALGSVYLEPDEKKGELKATIYNKNFDVVYLKDLVEKEKSKGGVYTIAKALLDVDDFKLNVPEDGGLEVEVKVKVER